MRDVLLTYLSLCCAYNEISGFRDTVEGELNRRTDARKTEWAYGMAYFGVQRSFMNQTHSSLGLRCAYAA